MLTSKQRRTCFHLWPMLPKYWTHGKSLKKTMLTFVVCLIFCLNYFSGSFKAYQNDYDDSHRDLKDSLCKTGPPRERQPWFFLVSCTACTHVSTCIYSIPICIKNCWSRVPWVLLLTFTHIDWRLLYLWCSSIYRTK